MLWGTNQPHISPTGSGEAAEPWHTHTHTHTFDQFLTQFWIKLITLTCWHTNDTYFWSSSVECPPSALLSVKEVWAAPRSGLMWATHTELPGVLLSYRCVEKHTHTHTPQLDQTTYLPCLCVCVCVCVSRSRTTRGHDQHTRCVKRDGRGGEVSRRTVTQLRFLRLSPGKVKNLH